MALSEAEKEFHAMLAVFATNARVQLNAITLSIYDEALSPFGYEAANKALRKIMMETKAWQMPTPKQIVDAIQPERSRLGEANEIVSKIFNSIAKIGYNSSMRAKEEIGDIGWKVVSDFGGWFHICTEIGVSMDPSSTRAQMRDLALSYLESKKIAAESLQIEGPAKSQQLLSTISILAKSKEMEK